jgi:hypothetical protein
MPPTRRVPPFGSLLVLLLASGPLFATPGNDAPSSSRESIPPPLQPWIPWVLHGHEEAFCPVVPGETGAAETSESAPVLVRACLWP